MLRPAGRMSAKRKALASMDSKYDDETVARAVDLLKTVKNVSKVSQMMGIPRSVLTSWRDGKRRSRKSATSVTTVASSGVSREPNVARAKKLTDKWNRSTSRALDIVNKRLEQLHQKGGSVTTDDIRGLKEVAWVAAVGTDKLQILTGGPTSINESRNLHVSLIAPETLRSGLKVVEAKVVDGVRVIDFVDGVREPADEGAA